MNKVLPLIAFFLLSAAFPNLLFAQWNSNETPTYPELIHHLKKLDQQHKEVELYAMGPSDYGFPIYLCIINGSGDSLSTMVSARSGTTILINNGIHPGEPDGINACLIWLDEWIKNGKKKENLPTIAFIPAYNVGGMMNRSGTSRANQEGPDEYGFRGNAQNLDLNRDFIKLDSKNAFTFSKIFHAIDPDVFVDTHVSNGADYQYTLTLISSVKERIAPSISELTYNILLPQLCEQLAKKKTDLFPYVNLRGETPDSGLEAFNDLPRYAMGYAALFHSLSFTVETHMLKPFPQRVKVTHQFIDELIKWTTSNATLIEDQRQKAIEHFGAAEHFLFDYQLTEKKDSIRFKGYEHSYPISEVTGLKRLKYHRDSPVVKYIPHYNEYRANDSIGIPSYFVVGAQAENVINRLKANGIRMSRIEKDTVIKLTEQRVISFESPARPYEGHFMHSKVEVERNENQILLKKGDMLVPTDQVKRWFLLHVLFAEAEDSYFTWNFFDSYVQQKEYFSSYVFEDKAIEILNANPALKKEFELRKASEEKFSSSSWEQLYFIYRNSEYFEPSWHLLPVYEIH
jgi:hypothetical protein